MTRLAQRSVKPVLPVSRCNIIVPPLGGEDYHRRWFEVKERDRGSDFQWRLIEIAGERVKVKLRLGQNLKTAVTQYLVGNMSSVVFLRGINVGGANLCRPALLAKQLARFDVVNIGAVGTFVVRENVSESVLRKAIAARLAKDFGVTCEIMICPARDIVRLASKDPFAGKPFGADVTRFVNVLARRLSSPLLLPLSLPSDSDWFLQVIAIENRFVLGMYRRQMKAISYLGKLEKLLGVPATNRNWNTMGKGAPRSSGPVALEMQALWRAMLRHRRV
jgi:uncharacterized protein (DUF1697 family)